MGFKLNKEVWEFKDVAQRSLISKINLTTNEFKSLHSRIYKPEQHDRNCNFKIN